MTLIIQQYKCLVCGHTGLLIANVQTKLDFTSKSNFQVIKEGNFITGDLGGKAKCSEFTDEIIRKIEAV